MIRTSAATAEERKYTGGMREWVPFEDWLVDRHGNRNIFVTKAREMGIVVKIGGAPFETVEKSTLEDMTSRFADAMDSFGPDFRIYQYLRRSYGCEVPASAPCRNPAVDDAAREREQYGRGLQTVEAYLVFLYERYRVPVGRLEKIWAALTTWGHEKLTGETREEQEYQVINKLVTSVRSFVRSFGDVLQLKVLNQHEAFELFGRMLNPDDEQFRHMQAADRRSSGMQWERQLCGTGLDVERNVLKLGDHFVRMLVMNERPRKTDDNLLRILMETPMQFLLVTEFNRIDNETMLAQIRKKIAWVEVASFNFAKYVFALLQDRKEEEEKRQDNNPKKAVSEAVEQLEQLESDIEHNRTWCGKFSLRVIVYDTDYGRLQAGINDMYSKMSDLTMTSHAESFGLQLGYFSCFPGNRRFNIGRYRIVNKLNYAHMSFLWLYQAWSRTRDLLRLPNLTVMESNCGTPVFIPAAVGDILHGFVCGQIGSGKSFLMNHLIMMYAKYPGALITIIDVGGSYRGIVAAMGGSYMEIDLNRLRVKINPFSLPRNVANIHYVYMFVKALIESDGFRMNGDQKADLYQQVRSVYRLPNEQHRTLGQLYGVLKKDLQDHLAQWVRKDRYGRAGAFGAIFDNATDTLTMAGIQAYDITGLDDYPEVAGPLLSYIIQRSRRRMHDRALSRTLKMIFIDEAWQRLLNTKDEEMPRFVLSTLKTGRKHWTGLYLCTQTLTDLGPQMEQIVNAIGRSFLLHNPAINEDQYRNLFSLNSEEVRIQRSMRPKEQCLLKVAGEPARLFSFRATRKEEELYSSTPQKEMDQSAYEDLVDDDVVAVAGAGGIQSRATTAVRG